MQLGSRVGQLGDQANSNAILSQVQIGLLTAWWLFAIHSASVLVYSALVNLWAGWAIIAARSTLDGHRHLTSGAHAHLAGHSNDGIDARHCPLPQRVAMGLQIPHTRQS